MKYYYIVVIIQVLIFLWSIAIYIKARIEIFKDNNKNNGQESNPNQTG